MGIDKLAEAWRVDVSPSTDLQPQACVPTWSQLKTLKETSMTPNATLVIKDNNTSMPVTASPGRGGFILRGHSLYLGDAYVARFVELSGNFAESPMRVLIQSHTEAGEALAIPHFPVRRN